jgi:hypothetical protein
MSKTDDAAFPERKNNNHTKRLWRFSPQKGMKISTLTMFTKFTFILYIPLI